MLKQDILNYVNSHDTKKSRAMAEYIKSNPCGWFGDCTEVFFKHDDNNNVSGHGCIDIIKKKTFKRNGKFVTVNIESKTNGGRINFSTDDKNDLIIYTLDVCNSTTGYKEILIDTRIMTIDYFLRVIEKNGASKKVNKKGMFDGMGIQVSKRGLWHDIESVPFIYNIGQTYDIDEIIIWCNTH